MFKKILLLLPFFIYFIVGAWVLDDYAQNWDEAVHFYRGQAYLHYFLTGKKDYSDLKDFKLYFQKDNTIFFDPVGVNKNEVTKRSVFQHNALGFKAWENRYVGHPPLSDIFSAFTNFVFFQKLGWINDIDSYHLYSLFLSAVLVEAIFLFVYKYFGFFASLISTLSLSLFPLFLGESHFNTKDNPEAAFYSLSLLTFYVAVVKKKNYWMILSAIFFAFAFGTKFNVVFLPFSILPWLIILLVPMKSKIVQYVKLLPSLLLYPVIVFGLFFASWPSLWVSPFKRFLDVVGYYRQIGDNSNFDPRYLTIGGFNTYAIHFVLYTTPLVILFFVLFGIVDALKNGWAEKNKTKLLILFWFLVPILRVTRPGTGIYGGIRQIMEFIPPMAILAGIGAGYLLQLLKKYSKDESILRFCRVLFLVLFIPVLLKLIQLHPNEGLYFNSLVGGYSGAVNKQLLDAGNDLGNVYKQSLRWMNANLEPNAKLALFAGLGSDIPAIQLRSDIAFSNLYRSGVDKKGEYVLGLVENFNSFGDDYQLNYYNNFLIPVHEITVDGVSVVKIWKNDATHTKPQYKNIGVLNATKFNVTDNTLLIDTGGQKKITEIIAHYDKNQACSQVPDGLTEVSDDLQNWETLANNIKVAGVSGFFYQPNGIFKYPFSAIGSRYIRFTFMSDTSCLKYVTKVDVYGVGN